MRAVGEGVDDVAVGDRVAWAMVNGTGYTSVAVVPADRVVPVPEGVTTEQAAAVLLQGMTAHYLSETTYAVQPGDDVLVHAAAGGTGLLLTQMVARKGGRVLATVSTDEKEALARGAGAAEVVRYDREDVAERVRELTGGRGVAVVYDGVGASTFDASLASLRTRGMLVLFGASSGPVPPFDPIRLMGGSHFLTRPTLAHYAAERAELLQRSGDVLAQVADGTLDVRIGARYPLDEAAPRTRGPQRPADDGQVPADPVATAPPAEGCWCWCAVSGRTDIRGAQQRRCAPTRDEARPPCRGVRTSARAEQRRCAPTRRPGAGHPVGAYGPPPDPDPMLPTYGSASRTSSASGSRRTGSASPASTRSSASWTVDAHCSAVSAGRRTKPRSASRSTWARRGA